MERTVNLEVLVGMFILGAIGYHHGILFEVISISLPVFFFSLLYGNVGTLFGVLIGIIFLLSRFIYKLFEAITHRN